jgi:hypothetical protein
MSCGIDKILRYCLREINETNGWGRLLINWDSVYTGVMGRNWSTDLTGMVPIGKDFKKRY